MPPAKSKPWSFGWLCTHCDSPQEYLVNEVKGQEPVWARCRRCSSLLTVTEDHRSLRVEAVKKL